MTGTLNMGGYNIFNAGAIAGNSISLGGSSTNFLMANGSSLSSAAYPTLVAESNYSTTFSAGGNTSTTYNITVRRLTNGTNTIVFLYLPQMVFTTGASSTTCSSNTALAVNLRPTIATGVSYNLHPVPIRNASTYTMGMLWIYPNGTVVIAPDLRDGSPSAAPANVSYGIPNQHTISYMVS